MGIVIGFSVDYVVHMGHMYIEAAEKSGAMKREDRFFYAASKMGSTVMAGAVTTAGSGAFMFLCQMRFFYKMAVLITLTIGFSFVYSLGFLCGSSLINEANEAVEARKNAVALWKKFKLKAIADGSDSSKNSKKSNQKKKTEWNCCD